MGGGWWKLERREPTVPLLCRFHLHPPPHAPRHSTFTFSNKLYKFISREEIKSAIKINIICWIIMKHVISFSSDITWYMYTHSSWIVWKAKGERAQSKMEKLKMKIFRLQRKTIFGKVWKLRRNARGWMSLDVFESEFHNMTDIRDGAAWSVHMILRQKWEWKSIFL